MIPLPVFISLIQLFTELGLLFSVAPKHPDLPDLDPNSVYLICTGSRQKQGFIAERFNLKDHDATHVGLGIVEHNQLLIFSVDNDRGSQSALQAVTLDDFARSNGLRYLSIWEYKSSKKTLKKLKQILCKFLQRKIVFDMDFDSGNEKLYCSEFCAVVLQKWNHREFCYQQSEKKLDDLYRGLLNRSSLHYYPVDFFQIDGKFKKIYENYPADVR